MVFCELVRKLNEDECTASTGVGGVLDHLVEKYEREHDDKEYYAISGLLWGLVGTGFITALDRGSLLGLLNVYKEGC